MEEKWSAHPQKNLAELGLTLEGVRVMAIDHVNRHGGSAIIQVRETLEGHDRPYYDKVQLEVEGIIPVVLVKNRGDVETADNPTVVLVSAHREGV